MPELGFRGGTLTASVTLGFPFKFSLKLFLSSLIEISKVVWTRCLTPRSASECRKDLFFFLKSFEFLNDFSSGKAA